MAAFGGYVSGFVVLSDLDLQIINTAKNFLDPSIQTRLFGLFTKLGIPLRIHHLKFMSHSDLFHDIKCQ